jgi:hypothetical protein
VARPAFFWEAFSFVFSFDLFEADDDVDDARSSMDPSFVDSCDRDVMDRRRIQTNPMTMSASNPKAIRRTVQVLCRLLAMWRCTWTMVTVNIYGEVLVVWSFQGK